MLRAGWAIVVLTLLAAPLAWSCANEAAAPSGTSETSEPSELKRVVASLPASSLTATRPTTLRGGSATSDLRSSAPFVTDPTAWGQTQKLVASSDTSTAHFGTSISISGTTALVGVPGAAGGRGAAYVFVQSGGGAGVPSAWTLEQELDAPVISLPATDGAFGASVSIDGTTALIGAPDANLAYVFVQAGGSAGTWTQQAVLAGPQRPRDGGALDVDFGASVSVSGTTAIVGAPGAAGTGPAAYVFVESSSADGGVEWTQQATLVGADGGSDGFGVSVSVSGSTALVGASVTGSPGAAYVFVSEDGGAEWTQQAKLLAGDSGLLVSAGVSVSISGTTAIVGSSESNQFHGGAYVFVASTEDGGVEWTQQAELVASDGGAGFGVSVSLSEATAIVGASQEPVGSNSAQGAAYIFVESGGTWTQQQMLVASDGRAGDGFGSSVAVSGSAALVGSPGAEVVAAGAGAAYAYTLLSANGTACGSAAECASGDCSAGVCTGCTGDTSCANGSYCGAGAACVPYEPIGGTCATKTGGDCLQASCAECGPCATCPLYSCVASTAGVSGSPSCGPYLCSGSSGSCPTACSSDAQCATPTYECSAGGSCLPVNGQPCAGLGPESCVSGFCSGGYCCDSACSGACQACNGADLGWTDAQNGACSVAPTGNPGTPACPFALCNGESATCVTSCTSDSACVSTAYCGSGGNCLEQVAQGGACSTTAGVACLQSGCRECATGNCIDGYCCNSACSGTCDTCSATPGTCTQLSADSPGNGRAEADGGVQSCAPFTCPGNSDTCSTSCTGDKQCGAGAFCSVGDAGAGTCVATQLLGTPCTSGDQCATGFCVDGVCCGTSTCGTCQACAAALQQSGPGNGTCGATAVGLAPHADCPTDVQSSCGHDGKCDGAGSCQYFPKGATCGANNTCVGNDVTGHVCDGFGTCQVASAANDAGAVGVDCTPYVCPAGGTGCTAPCASDGDCVSGYWCSLGTCLLKAANGATCTTSTKDGCSSGNCVEGVCCDKACNGTCQTCLGTNEAPLADGGTAPNGTCGNAVAGVPDPSGTCTAQGVVSCGTNGLCDGNGGCQNYAKGVTCVATACNASNAVQTSTCNGQGACIASSTPCGAFKCVGSTCNTTCATDSDCTTGAYCDGTTCKAQAQNGQACTANDQCASTICADGVCCNAACGGQCEACDVQGTVGTCTPVVGAPQPPRAACATGTATNPCAAALCDGIHTTSCDTFVGPSVPCGEASCTNSVAQAAGSCDGNGTCKLPPTSSCGTFACAGTVCGTTCTTDDECATGDTCDTATGQCTRGSTCGADGVTLTNPAGQPTSCAPFKCSGSACLTSCKSVDDCVSPAVCDTNGACVAPAAASNGASGTSSSGGCGCETVGGEHGGSRPGSVAALALALLATWRRRRSRAFARPR